MTKNEWLQTPEGEQLRAKVRKGRDRLLHELYAAAARAADPEVRAMAGAVAGYDEVILEHLTPAPEEAR